MLPGFIQRLFQLGLFGRGGGGSPPTPPTLGTLSLSTSSFAIGVATSGGINGATSGSTITAPAAPPCFTVDTEARTFAYDGTGSAGTDSFNLVETLFNASNTPNSSPVTITLSADPTFTELPTWTLSEDGTTYTATGGTAPGASVETDFLLNFASNDSTTIAVSANKGVLGYVRSVATVGEASATVLSASSFTIAGSPGAVVIDPMTTTSGTEIVGNLGWIKANSADSTMPPALLYESGQAKNTSGTTFTTTNFITQDTGAADHAIEFTFEGAGSAIGAASHVLYAALSTWPNFLYLFTVGTLASHNNLLCLQLAAVVGGSYVGNTNGYAYAPTPVDGDVWRLQIVLNAVSLYVNGTQYSFGAQQTGSTAVVTPGNTTINAASISGFPTGGTCPGFMLGAGNVGGEVQLYDLIQPFSLLSASDSIGAGGAAIYPTTAGRQIYFVGTYTGTAPSGTIDYQFVSPAGVTVASGTATVDTASGGIVTATAFVPLVGPTWDGATVYPSIANGGAYAGLPIGQSMTLAVQAIIAPTVLGMNTSFNYYSDTEHRFRDIAKSSALYSHPSGTAVTVPSLAGANWPSPTGTSWDGIPHNLAPGDTYWTVYFPAVSLSDQQGVEYIITHNLTGTVTVTLNGWSGVTLTQINGTQWKFTVPNAVIPYGTNPYLNFTGGTTQSGPGFIFSILPNDGLTQIANPTFVTDFDAMTASGSFIRFMTELQTNTTLTQNGANYTLTTGDVSYAMCGSNATTSASDFIALCNSSNRNAWPNVHDQSDSGYWTDFANVLAGNTPAKSPGLNAGLKVAPELSNETWNGAFSQRARMAQVSWNLGYGSLTSPTSVDGFLTGGTLNPQSATTFVTVPAVTVTGATWSGGQLTVTTATDLSASITAGTPVALANITQSGSGASLNANFIAVSASTDTIVLTATSSTQTYVSGGTATLYRTPGAAYSSGAQVFEYTSGIDFLGVWQAAANITDGEAAAFLPLTETGNTAHWTYLAGLGSQSQTTALDTALSYYVSDQTVAIGEVFYTAFGAEAAERVVRVMMDWNGGSNGPGVGLTRMKTKLAWNNNWRKMDNVGCSCYSFGQYKNGGTTYSTGNFANGDSLSAYSSYLSASMSTSDLANFLTGYFEQVAAQLPFDLAIFAAYRQGLEQWMRATFSDYTPNSLGFGFYEGSAIASTGQTEFSGTTTQLGYLVNTTINGVTNQNILTILRQDARFGTAWQNYLEAMQSYIGGIQCMFDYAGAIRTTNTSDWSILGYTGDTTDPCYGAFEAVANP